MPLKLHLEAPGSGVKRLCVSASITKITLNVNKVQISMKNLPTFICLFLTFLKAKFWGWCTYLCFELLERVVQYTWGCCKCADLSRLLAASFTLYSSCTGRRDRRFEWPVQTPRLVPPPAVWEIWEEDFVLLRLPGLPQIECAFGVPQIEAGSSWESCIDCFNLYLICSPPLKLCSLTHHCCSSQ